jgi:hypothetical protein
MAHRGDNTQEIQQTGRRDGAHTVELDARPLAKGVWREDGIGGPLLAEGAHSPAKEAILQQGGMNDDGVRIEREDVREGEGSSRTRVSSDIAWREKTL